MVSKQQLFIENCMISYNMKCNKKRKRKKRKPFIQNEIRHRL